MTRFNLSKYVLLALLTNPTAEAFTLVAPQQKSFATTTTTNTIHSFRTTKVMSSIILFNSEGPTEEEIDTALSKTKLSEEEVVQVGNLVADDEWMGLGMELSEMVRVAVIEEAKKNTADFIGKDEYKMGDITKEIDSRVKDEIANMRGKDEYELGDLTVALDEISKDMTCKLTGKEDYDFGDLSSEIDTRVKSSVAEYCGKDTYEFGDLTSEIDRRSQVRVLDFIGKDEYEFGDITKEIENRRKDWIKGFLGAEAAENYEFGDITKKALTTFTGKDEYEFGDVTKKLMGGLFGKRKRGGK